MTALVLLAAAAGSCLPVDGDRIAVRDLGAADGAFLAVDPSESAGYAPAPGARRIFHPAELARLAKRYGVMTGTPREVCFERQTAPLGREPLESALMAAVDHPSAQVELLEWCRYPAPAGRIVFSPGGFSAQAPEKPAVWKGYVAYGERGRFAIWARVRVSVPVSRVVTARPVAAGHILEAADIRVETARGLPFRPQAAATPEHVLGKMARRPIPAGRPILPGMVDSPRDISAGDAVHVLVASGRARLDFEGRAEGGGRRGDLIAVRNVAGGRSFRARVVERGKVEITVEAPLINPGEKIR
jgi:flagella basal body P-ring formation protein FlgA